MWYPAVIEDVHYVTDDELSRQGTVLYRTLMQCTTYCTMYTLGYTKSTATWMLSIYVRKMIIYIY